MKTKYYNMTFLRISLLVLTVGFFTSCKFIVPEITQTEVVEFILPQWPPESYKAIEAPCNSPYPELGKWLVEVTCTSQCQQFFLEPHIKSFCLEITKNEPVAVSAFPITLNTSGQLINFFKPCGTVFPYDFDNGKQKLSWCGGFSSYVFQMLFNSKKETGVTTEHMIRYLRSFNWKKFQETLESKAAKQTENKNGAFYNPWLINRFLLLDNLSYGNFKPDFLDMKNVVTYSESKLSLPADVELLSSYIPENENIRATGRLTLQKNQIEYFVCNTDFAAIILYTSAKNISLQYGILPIFIEEI